MVDSSEYIKTLKEYYPDSKQIDFGRKYNELPPPSNIRRPERNEPTKQSKSKNTGSEIKHYIADDPERFVDPRTVAGDLIYKLKDKIHDKKSLISTVKEAFSKDNFLSNYVNSNHSLSKDDIDALMNNKRVQAYIKTNSTNIVITYLTKRLFIGKAKANRVYNLLPQDSQAKLLVVAQRQQNYVIKRVSVPISQPISRPKRVSFSRQELNYINMNKHLSPTKITERLNIVFENNRSQASVLNRIKEFRKQK